MQDWQDYITGFFAGKAGDLWVWFDSLSRQEWLIVMAACCAFGFLFLKSGGHRGPC
ncbi:hypothetical protein Pla108_04780 [Botrimarina colliarenosi]|uniref:Uncharacterized protein n=1 Tax=Botrimarina colliarenosi TaxID=2528001 RepID=A0A5C6AK44_9BACT|nr:hypothetical protein [Botrimarina colliarenosi]TWT99535.1 hypothetical protein Pla108_04780 [Botrimarina colliarenosi]